MVYIDIEKTSRDCEFNMHNLHTHGHYEIYYLIEGTRYFYFNESFYKLSAPTIIIIPPYTPHKTEGSAYTRININVSSNYLNEFQLKTLNHFAMQPFVPNEEHTAELLKTLEWLNEAYINYDDKYVIDTLFSYFILLIKKIHKDKNNPVVKVDKKTPTSILNVVAYLNHHFSEKIQLDDIAKQFHISKSTLIYQFKKSLACTPIDYLLITRIAKAEKMLLETDKSINEISEACGFSSPSYFGIIFKQKKKISPANFRKAHR